MPSRSFSPSVSASYLAAAVAWLSAWDRADLTARSEAALIAAAAAAADLLAANCDTLLVAIRVAIPVFFRLFTACVLVTLCEAFRGDPTVHSRIPRSIERPQKHNGTICTINYSPT